VLLFGADASAASSHAVSRCAHAGTTLAAGSGFRVYALRVGGEPRTYGCVRSSGRRTRLDLPCTSALRSCADKASKVVLRGRWVAVEFRGFVDGAGGQSYTTIIRRDLRTNLPKFILVLDDQSSDRTSPIVDGLFVSPRGGLAYSSDDLDEGEGRTGLVGYLPPPQNGGNVRDRFLDFSPGVVGPSLRVGGGLIRWLNAGVEKTAAWR
jgi:hypothetical protein